MPENISGIILFVLVAVPLAALWIGSMLSIARHSHAMSGLEFVAWLALVIFAQFIGPLVWFFVGRDRYRQLR